jgi:hypothetical protein
MKQRDMGGNVANRGLPIDVPAGAQGSSSLVTPRLTGSTIAPSAAGIPRSRAIVSIYTECAPRRDGQPLPTGVIPNSCRSRCRGVRGKVPRESRSA